MSNSNADLITQAMECMAHATVAKEQKDYRGQVNWLRIAHNHLSALTCNLVIAMDQAAWQMAKRLEEAELVADGVHPEQIRQSEPGAEDL